MLEQSKVVCDYCVFAWLGDRLHQAVVSSRDVDIIQKLLGNASEDGIHALARLNLDEGFKFLPQFVGTLRAVCAKRNVRWLAVLVGLRGVPYVEVRTMRADSSFKRNNVSVGQVCACNFACAESAAKVQTAGGVVRKPFNVTDTHTLDARIEEAGKHIELGMRQCLELGTLPDNQLFLQLRRALLGKFDFVSKTLRVSLAFAGGICGRLVHACSRAQTAKMTRCDQSNRNIVTTTTRTQACRNTCGGAAITISSLSSSAWMEHPDDITTKLPALLERIPDKRVAHELKCIMLSWALTGGLYGASSLALKSLSTAETMATIAAGTPYEAAMANAAEVMRYSNQGWRTSADMQEYIRVLGEHEQTLTRIDERRSAPEPVSKRVCKEEDKTV